MADAEPLQSRLTHEPIVVAPGVYDAFTALLATQAGFTTLYVSGAAIAYTRLARPDIGFVSMAEVAQTVATIRDRVAAHLVVDPLPRPLGHFRDARHQRRPVPVLRDD